MHRANPPTLAEVRGLASANAQALARGRRCGKKRGSVARAAFAAGGGGGDGGDGADVQPDSLDRKVSETVQLQNEIKKRREALKQPLADLKELERLCQKNMAELNEYMERSGATRISSTDGDVVLEKKSAREKLDKETKRDAMIRVAREHRVMDAGPLVNRLLEIRGEKTEKSVVHVNAATPSVPSHFF